jgi:response regulator RpfG family c-di-GMP phosphodiesterase
MQIKRVGIIISERERHFDPDVVDAFVGGFTRFAAVAEKYRESD